MRKFLTYCAVIILFVSCGPSETQNKYLTYQNLIILSDLSTRINNMPLKDIDEIHKIVQFFKNECVKPGEKIGDNSCLLFSIFSEKVIACIDLDKIKVIADKQQFINSTGKYENTGLSYQIGDFESKVKKAYTSKRDPGLDLISILIEKIGNDPLIKKNIRLTDGMDTTFVNYDNHIYIFTDGYLEYQNKNINSQFYFSSSEIDKIRKFSMANKVGITKALQANASLCLPSYKSDKNQHINLHVLETHERDKNYKLQIYENPTGLRDNEILEAVWRKWAQESGFKSFEWRKY